MKDKANQAVKVVLILVAALASYGAVRLWFNNQNTNLDRDSYVRIAQKACVNEAVKVGVTNSQAESYCKCVLDDIYAGKSVKQMQAMDAEVIDGALPEKYDAIVIECASRVQ